MPLTDIQRQAVPLVRARFQSVLSILGTAESVEERARLPAPETLPPDLNVRVEIAPSPLHPDPTIERTGVSKTPERVPIYFFTHTNDRANSEADPPESLEDTRVIFFLHGGGNVTGHPTHEPYLQYFGHMLRAVASQSGGASKCVLVAPSYRLATVPENAFPAGLQDVVTAYDYVLGKGYKPSNIVVAGDSAGGGHAVVLTHLVMQSGKPCPRGIIAIAPLLMQTNEFMSDYAKKVAVNDVIDLAVGEKMYSVYLGESGVAPTDPLVSGVFLPFTAAWPRTLILVGSGDALIDSSRELEKHLTAVKVPVELVEYDERPHGWWIVGQLFPEDVQDSVKRIARFVLGA